MSRHFYSVSRMCPSLYGLDFAIGDDGDLDYLVLALTRLNAVLLVEVLEVVDDQ